MQLAPVGPADREAVAYPIFLLGITMRCGTNYLHDLLRLHPECTPRLPIWEDHVLYHADPLIQYAQTLCAYWKDAWKISQEDEDRLHKCLGDGLAAFLNAGGNGKRVVTKTPTVGNLRYYRKFFPNAPLLIIYRDGRAVVESALNSFEMSFEQTVRIWAGNAREILQFLRADEGGLGSRYLVVKYETLVENVRQEMSRVLAFLELDPEAYDFSAAENLPVRGSSAFRGDKKDKVHWDPVQKSADFRPLQRFSHWSRGRHKRFNWIAGEPLRQLGYEPLHTDRSVWWDVWNRLLDAKWGTKTWLQRNLAAARKRLGNIGQMFR
jgi:hypothetical protein